MPKPIQPLPRTGSIPRRRARAIAATQAEQSARMGRAGLIAGAAALALAAMAALTTAEAGERGNAAAPALDYPPQAETPSRVVQGGKALTGDRPTRGGAPTADGWALDPAPAVAPRRTIGTGPGRPATDETEPRGGPTSYTGAYRLVSVNSQDLPVRIDRFRTADGRVCEEYVLSGAIQLMPDNTYAVRNLTRVECPDGDEERRREVERGTWKLTGNAVYLNEDRIRGEEPAHGQYMADVPIDNLGGTAELEGRRLIIGLEDGRSVAVFEATNARPGPG